MAQHAPIDFKGPFPRARPSSLRLVPPNLDETLMKEYPDILSSVSLGQGGVVISMSFQDGLNTSPSHSQFAQVESLLKRLQTKGDLFEASFRTLAIRSLTDVLSNKPKDLRATHEARIQTLKSEWSEILSGDNPIKLNGEGVIIDLELKPSLNDSISPEQNAQLQALISTINENNVDASAKEAFLTTIQAFYDAARTRQETSSRHIEDNYQDIVKDPAFDLNGVVTSFSLTIDPQNPEHIKQANNLLLELKENESRFALVDFAGTESKLESLIQSSPPEVRKQLKSDYGNILVADAEVSSNGLITQFSLREDLTTTLTATQFAELRKLNDELKEPNYKRWSNTIVPGLKKSVSSVLDSTAAKLLDKHPQFIQQITIDPSSGLIASIELRSDLFDKPLEKPRESISKFSETLLDPRFAKSDFYFGTSGLSKAINAVEGAQNIFRKFFLPFQEVVSKININENGDLTGINFKPIPYNGWSGSQKVALYNLQNNLVQARDHIFGSNDLRTQFDVQIDTLLNQVKPADLEQEIRDRFETSYANTVRPDSLVFNERGKLTSFVLADIGAELEELSRDSVFSDSPSSELVQIKQDIDGILISKREYNRVLSRYNLIIDPENLRIGTDGKVLSFSLKPDLTAESAEVRQLRVLGTLLADDSLFSSENMAAPKAEMQSIFDRASRRVRITKTVSNFRDKYSDILDLAKNPDGSFKNLTFDDKGNLSSLNVNPSLNKERSQAEITSLETFLDDPLFESKPFFKRQASDLKVLLSSDNQLGFKFTTDEGFVSLTSLATNGEQIPKSLRYTLRSVNFPKLETGQYFGSYGAYIVDYPNLSKFFDSSLGKYRTLSEVSSEIKAHEGSRAGWVLEEGSISDLLTLVPQEDAVRDLGGLRIAGQFPSLNNQTADNFLRPVLEDYHGLRLDIQRRRATDDGGLVQDIAIQKLNYITGEAIDTSVTLRVDYFNRKLEFVDSNDPVNDQTLRARLNDLNIREREAVFKSE